MTKPPIIFDPSFEIVPDDEAETQRGLTDTMLDINGDLRKLIACA